MRAVLQRVSSAAVYVDDTAVGKIGAGILALIGVENGDVESDARYIAEKIAITRCFNDQEGKMNLSLQDVCGSVLAISQFTLHGDCRKGRRPSFGKAAPPDTAIPLYEYVVQYLREEKGLTVDTGVFGAKMQVTLTNEGPVTLILDSRKTF